MRGNKLWVVMPVYNEEASVVRVLDEWVPLLRDTVESFTFFAINDGSTDRTLQRLKEYSTDCPEIKILDKNNTGHGQSCIEGYRYAVNSGAEWILQIDSDGQCDGRYFLKFWELRNRFPVLFGYRKRREDGYARFVISRLVTLFTWAATGCWLRDANVPYRLMRNDHLKQAIPFIPSHIHLANILLSVIVERNAQIYWLPIVFRDRFGGKSSLKSFSLVKHGCRLFVQLREVTRSRSL